MVPIFWGHPVYTSGAGFNCTAVGGTDVSSLLIYFLFNLY